MYRQYDSWWSPSLNRTMEFLWLGQFGRPLMMFPTSGGRFVENDDFHLTDALADKVDRGEIQLCCVDSVDSESWYNKAAHPRARTEQSQLVAWEREHSDVVRAATKFPASLPT